MNESLDMDYYNQNCKLGKLFCYQILENIWVMDRFLSNIHRYGQPKKAVFRNVHKIQIFVLIKDIIITKKFEVD